MFLHRLCLALGGMTVRELERRMSAGEFHDWLVYYAQEPFGEDRADLRAGIVASTIANVHRGKGGKAFSPRDFMPYAAQAESETIIPQSPEHEALLVESVIRGLGLKIIEKKNDAV